LVFFNAGGVEKMEKKMNRRKYRKKKKGKNSLASFSEYKESYYPFCFSLKLDSWFSSIFYL
jgi:hypothetical protein